MKKVLKVLLLCVMSVVILSGCIRMNMEVTVNKDGSGKISYVIAYDRSLEAIAREFGGGESSSGESMRDQLNGLKTELAGKGFKVNDYSEGEYIGIKALADFKKVQEIPGLFKIEEEGLFETFDIDIKKGLLTTEYNFKAKVREMDAQMANFIDSSFTVNLPVEVKESNSETSGKTLRWNLVNFGSREIEARLEVTNTANIMIMIIGAVVLIIIVALLAMKVATRDWLKYH